MVGLDTSVADKFRHLVYQSLIEDDAGNDVTTLATIEKDDVIGADLVMNEEGVVGALFAIPFFFEQLGAGVEVTLFVSEGQRVPAGSRIARLSGNARAILSAERAIINLVQHVSSIATETAKYVAIAKPYGCDILDTRKTLPALRCAQKYGVKLGGGKNHRRSLSEQVLIKDNHLLVTTMGDAVRKARTKYPEVQIEIEVEKLSDLADAITLRPEAILLDNMTPDEIRRAVAIIPDPIYTEASGGITLHTLAAYAATGVNGISIGALTHSVRALDMSLSLGEI